MREHQKYDRDNDVRRDVTELLREHGYTVEAWSLADKPADDERVLTIKAMRDLRVEQTSLRLEQR